MVTEQTFGHCMLPVTQLFGQTDIQNMRKNVNKLSSIAEGCANGVHWSDVIQLCIKSNKEVSATNITHIH